MMYLIRNLKTIPKWKYRSFFQTSIKDMAKFLAQKHHPNEAGTLIDDEVKKEVESAPDYYPLVEGRYIKFNPDFKLE